MTGAQDHLGVASQLLTAGNPIFHASENRSFDPAVTDKRDVRSKEYWLPARWQDVVANAALIERHRRGTGHHALCLVTGVLLDGVDVDVKNGADIEVERRALAEYGVVTLGETRTANRGAHFFVMSTGIGTSAHPVAGVDYRGGRADGSGRGFLYLPGTRRPRYGGAGYQWITPPDLDLLARLDQDQQHSAVSAYLASRGMTPAGSAARFASAPDRTQAVPSEPVGDLPQDLRLALADLTAGPRKADGSMDRSARFFHLVGQCRRHKLTQGQTVTVLTPWCTAVGKFVGREASQVADAWNKVDPATDTNWMTSSNPEETHTMHVATAVSMANMTDPTDAADKPAINHDKGALASVPLGRRMAGEALKGNFIFVEGVGWLGWDGRRWAGCTEKRVAQVAASWAEEFIMRLIKDGAANEDVRFALRYREVGNVRNLISGALTAEGSANIMVDATNLDRNPDLLNVGNGTLHLPTMTLRPHNPADFITKLTKVNYVPGATHPDVATALSALDPTVREYVRRSFGAAASGYMGSDDRMEVHSGGGANGKSTVVGAVFQALGEYATIVPDELVLASTGHEHPTLLMTLRGVRLALLEELPDGHAFNVARVKKTVGTPKITGRLIGQNFVTFDTSHTMVVTTNHLPLITETDHGAWRRLVRIPYPYQYGKDRPRDPGLRERVLTGRGQQEAVLAWIATGARDWYAAGRTLGELPEELAQAVREWRASTDLLFMFAEECLDIGQGKEVFERTEDLRTAFNRWLKPPNRPWTARSFSERVANHPAFTESGAQVGKHPKNRQSVVWAVALKPTQGTPSPS